MRTSGEHVRRVVWGIAVLAVLAGGGWLRRARSGRVAAVAADAARLAAEDTAGRVLDAVRRDRLVPEVADAVAASTALDHALADLSTAVRRRARLVPTDPAVAACESAVRDGELAVGRLSVAAAAGWLGDGAAGSLATVRDDLDVVRRGVLPTALGHEVQRPLALEDPVAAVDAAVAVVAGHGRTLRAALAAAVAGGPAAAGQ